MKPEVKQQLRRNASIAVNCVTFIFAIVLLPFILIIAGPALWSVLNGNVDFNQSSNLFAMGFTIFFILFIGLSIWILVKYRASIQGNLDIYLQAAEDLQIEIDPQKLVFTKEIPFGGGSIGYSSPTGLGILTRRGKTFEIFHDYEQRNAPKMIMGGFSTRVSALPITIIETSNLPSDISMMILQKTNLQNNYPGYQFNYQQFDLDSDCAALVFNQTDLTIEKVQENLAKILGSGYLAKFKQLPGKNSLLIHKSFVRLHHENFANTEVLTELVSFLAEITSR